MTAECFNTRGLSKETKKPGVFHVWIFNEILYKFKQYYICNVVTRQNGFTFFRLYIHKISESLISTKNNVNGHGMSIKGSLAIH